MNKHELEQLRPLIEQAIKDTALVVNNSTKKENSGLVYSLKDVFEQRMAEMMTHVVEIKTQTTKTNGRVTKLESHRTWLWGAYTMLTILGSAIIYLSIMAIDSKIEKGISNALSKYDITYETEN